jgi:hypothetical protein
LGGGATLSAESPEELVEAVAEKSVKSATHAAQTCLDLFPAPEDPPTLDPLAKLDSPEFWSAVAANAQARPAQQAAFVDLLSKLFETTGAAARALVEMAQRELSNTPAPAPLPSPKLARL